MQNSREKRVILFVALAFFSALCAAQPNPSVPSVNFTRFLDDEGVETLQLRCALPDEPSECELTKQRNEFVVDRIRLRRDVVDSWLASFLQMAGAAAQKDYRKPQSTSDAPFLKWQVQGQKFNSQGVLFRRDMTKTLPDSLSVLHDSLIELEAVMSLSFVKP